MGGSTGRSVQLRLPKQEPEQEAASQQVGSPG